MPLPAGEPRRPGAVGGTGARSAGGFAEAPRRRPDRRDGARRGETGSRAVAPERSPSRRASRTAFSGDRREGGRPGSEGPATGSSGSSKVGFRGGGGRRRIENLLLPRPDLPGWRRGRQGIGKESLGEATTGATTLRTPAGDGREGGRARTPLPPTVPRRGCGPLPELVPGSLGTRRVGNTPSVESRAVPVIGRPVAGFPLSPSRRQTS